MRARGLAAAAAGATGAAVGHALDVAGLLPGVHETEAVRTAMGPGLTVLWLTLAAGLAWLASVTRPVQVGIASSLLVSGVPELVGRRDPGAMGEPGAIAGALLQCALLLLVVGVAVLVEHQLPRSPLPSPDAPPGTPTVVVSVRTAKASVVCRDGRPRGPPLTALPAFFA